MGGLEDCTDGHSADCKFFWIFLIVCVWHFFLDLLPTIFIAVDIWRAFKKRKHWIPPLSLVLSSFSLMLLALLNKSLHFPYDDYTLMGSLARRASVCLFMGYLLPAVGNPLSPNIWNDMAALTVVTSLPLFQIAYDIYRLFTDPHTLYSTYGSNSINSATRNLAIGWNVTMFVSIILVVVLLSCATVASVGIHQFTCHKIPIILSFQKFSHQFSWVKVEEHIIKSVVLVRSSSHQYILSRSILTSPIAFITAICIWILIDVSLLRIRIEFGWQMVVLYPFIILASGVIVWRCITATVYYPRQISWKWSSIKQYFQMEDFWLSYLKQLQAKSLRVEGMDKSRFKKLMNKLWRGTVVHKTLRVLIWVQTFSVVLSKACWLVLQLLLSNRCMEWLFMLSASQEFSDLNREKDQRRFVLGKASDFDKYYDALLQLPGEYPAGIWIANRKSIEFVQKKMKMGVKEGKRCNELIWLLKDKSSPDFRGEKHVKPHQNYLVMRLEVERDLDVCKPSFKMAAVSLLTLMAELASFIPNGNNLINKAIEACFQAWNIMDIVEDSESEGVMLSKTADKLFQDLKKSRTWLGYRLPLNKDVDHSVGAAKASIRNVVDKAKQMAMDYKSKKLEEVAAGYRLYWLSLNLNYQELTSVEEIVDKMCSALADVVASCTAKAVGVAVKDCKKWTTRFEEDSIFRAAHIVGEVRNLMENVEWQLKWSISAETQSVETSVERARNRRLLRKYATFQNPGLEFDGL